MHAWEEKYYERQKGLEKGLLRITPMNQGCAANAQPCTELLFVYCIPITDSF